MKGVRKWVAEVVLQADERFTLTVWGEAMAGDDEWMFKTPELQGRGSKCCEAVQSPKLTRLRSDFPGLCETRNLILRLDFGSSLVSEGDEVACSRGSRGC